ncbi:XRE family transcriptional regulator [Alcaligenes sp. AB3]|uniref:XRE family transcriptional regulator n=1 Tax=Alcaligenes sp. AB3 TaxID=2962569 RepID=UPI002881D8A5|nr:XRE family transcriptional regulator [Alcaligenes sp. AB3]MDT0215846.1 XRE family transcriptional regulator [Alcaligenes sp. AB3]
MTTIHDRIKQARLDKGLSMEGLAELVGLRSWQSIQQWENGATAPQRKRLERVASALGVTVDFLMNGTLESATKAATNGGHVPVRLVDAKASAGKGKLIFYADDNRELMFQRSWLSKNGAKPEDVLAFPVEGDSMVDAHIPDGSVVLVNTKLTEPTPKRIYVLSIDNELMLKELAQVSGKWVARSRNNSKANELIDIDIGIDDRIIGRAFWCGFKI